MSSHPTPLDAAHSCLCLATSKAARALARRYDAAFRPLEITNGQFSILIAVALDLPVGLADVAEALGMDRTTLTAALKPLSRRGLVTISPDPADARLRRLGLTEQGRSVVEAALPVWRQIQAEVAAQAGGSDLLHRLNRLQR